MATDQLLPHHRGYRPVTPTPSWLQTSYSHTIVATDQLLPHHRGHRPITPTPSWLQTSYSHTIVVTDQLLPHRRGYEDQEYITIVAIDQGSIDISVKSSIIFTPPLAPSGHLAKFSNLTKISN